MSGFLPPVRTFKSLGAEPAWTPGPASALMEPATRHWLFIARKITEMCERMEAAAQGPFFLWGQKHVRNAAVTGCSRRQALHDAMAIVAIHGADLTNMSGAKST